MYNLIIIGGGAAGLAAGLYASRFKLNTAIIAKEFGGTGNIAHKIDNWIGEPGISGLDLMQKFVNHVKKEGLQLLSAIAVKITKTDVGFIVETGDGSHYEAKMIILANGMEHRRLGVPGEKEFEGRGVHYCYTCDGPFYKNKTVTVIGGSDSAAQAALFLTSYGNKVYMVIRRETLTAEPITAEQVKAHGRIEIVPKSNVAEIIGREGKVTGVTLDTGRVLDLDGVFVEVGHLPASELAKSAGVDTDEQGFIKVNRKQETNVPGILAAGDITDATDLKQFITSAAEGSIAAQTAYRTLGRH